MTVSTTVMRLRYTGDASNVTFAIPGTYPDSPDILESDEIEVITRDETTTPPTEATKTNPTHYSISGSNVVFVVAPAVGIKVLVWRQVSLKNEDFNPSTGGQYTTSGVESAVDRLTKLIQQVSERVDRAPLLRKTSGTTGLTLEDFTAKAGYSLIVNAGATGIDLQAPNSAAATSVVAPSNGIATGVTLQTVLDCLNTRVYGTRASPQNITVAGVSATAGVAKQVWYIQGSGGSIDLTGVSPPITAGTLVGQEIELNGCNDTNTVLIGGTGTPNIATNGVRTLRNGTTLGLRWDGTQYHEIYFNNL